MDTSKPEYKPEEDLEELLEGEEFDELLRWIVRTLAGEGESIFEGIFALKKRLQQQAFSMAQAYGWGKALGMVVPWIIDWGSRLAGIDVYGVEGFYIPFFYAMSDQLGANIAGFVYILAANLCWVPPLVGMLVERRRRT